MSGWRLATTEGGTGLTDGAGGSGRVQATTVAQSRMVDRCRRNRFMKRGSLVSLSVDLSFEHSVCVGQGVGSDRSGPAGLVHTCVQGPRWRGRRTSPGSCAPQRLTKSAGRSTYSVMARSYVPARKPTSSLEHRPLSAVNSRISEEMADGPGWIAGAELTEIDACASAHLQPVGRTAFFQEHLDVSVAVDQRLGCIG